MIEVSPATEHLTAVRFSRLPTKTELNRLKRWADTLRSGQYQQITSYLHTPDGFCCLGVACNMTRTRKWIDVGDTGLYFGKSTNGGGEDKMPPAFVDQYFIGDIKYTQLIDRDPYCRLTLEILPQLLRISTQSLSGLNDDGKTFAEIADVIDECITRFKELAEVKQPA